MKKVYIDAPTIIGGVFYEVSHLPQSVPESVADLLCRLGNARPFETKIETVEEKKTGLMPASSASPAAQALQKPTVTRRGRRPKS